MKRIREISAVIMLAFAMIISTLALYLPPQGVIDPSVLWIVAQALLFAASVLGLDTFARKLMDQQKDNAPTQQE